MIAALRRAGFEVVRQRGSHVSLRQPVTGRRATVPDHGGRDLKHGLLRGILTDAGLSVEEFLGLLR